MNIKVKYITNTGLKRPVNEDAILIDKTLIFKTSMEYSKDNDFIIEQQFLCAVADGMGGHGKGEIASSFVLKNLKNSVIQSENLRSILMEIKNNLDLYSQDNTKYNNMGTVLAGVLISSNEYVVFNVGDSRVYENNGGYTKQLSRDHSVVYSLYEAGEISYEDIKNHAQKNIVCSAFVSNKKSRLEQIFIKKFDMTSFPKEFIICSDGVWEAVELCDFDKCFKQDNPVEFLKDIVLENGAEDNFSLIYIKVINE